MTWDADDIEETRQTALVDEAARRIELRRQRAEVAGRNVQALGRVGGKLVRHVTTPTLGFFARLGQSLPWAALGVAAGGAGFLVYLALRRKPRPQVIVVPPQPRARKQKRGRDD